MCTIFDCVLLISIQKTIVKKYFLLRRLDENDQFRKSKHESIHQSILQNKTLWNWSSTLSTAAILARVIQTHKVNHHGSKVDKQSLSMSHVNISG